MGLKTTPYWLLPILFFIVVGCQNAAQNSFPQKLPDTSQIDTTLWLNETRGIRDILEDRDGNLWFSSPDYIARFDGESMQYFTEEEGLNITGNMHEDANGTIWVENGFDAYQYDGQQFIGQKIEKLRNTQGLWIQQGLRPTDTTKTIPGMYEIGEHSPVFHPFPIDRQGNTEHLFFPSTKAALGQDGTVWFGTMEKVFGFKDGSFTAIGRAEMGRQHDERNMGIRGIFVDHLGNLWMADNGAGLFVYDGKETTNFTQKYHLDENDGPGNTLHRAFSVAEDADGIMWFGTVYSGIWSFHPTTEHFENYTTEQGVLSDTIWTIYKTRGGTLLFAGETPAAVYVFNGTSFDRLF